MKRHPWLHLLRSASAAYACFIAGVIPDQATATPRDIPGLSIRESCVIRPMTNASRHAATTLHRKAIRVSEETGSITNACSCPKAPRDALRHPTPQSMHPSGLRAQRPVVHRRASQWLANASLHPRMRGEGNTHRDSRRLTNGSRLACCALEPARSRRFAKAAPDGMCD